ncbi:hypothetical protein ILFOPFJJ_05868 [Ensifer psoraleae]|nr:hypothetical protein [Sinorhizobium psoraleae]
MVNRWSSAEMNEAFLGCSWHQAEKELEEKEALARAETFNLRLASLACRSNSRCHRVP